MSLPNGFYPIKHTFGVDNFDVSRGGGAPIFAGDNENDGSWPVFIEGVIVPLSQAPFGWQQFGLLDRFPRTVYYGGPTTKLNAPNYIALFENWARSLGYAYDTAIIPIQPNFANAPWPRRDFVWYWSQNETRPPTRYRFLRVKNDNYFRWYDYGYDQFKYANFHAANPNVV